MNHKGEENTSEARRSLLTVDEILYFDRDEQIVVCGNDKPMRLRKTRYWERPEFADRFNPNPYINKRPPRNLWAPFKKALGDLAYGMAWLFAPHPTAMKIYLIASIVAAITLYFDIVGMP